MIVAIFSDLQNKEQMFRKLYEYLCTTAIKEQQKVRIA